MSKPKLTPTQRECLEIMAERPAGKMVTAWNYAPTGKLAELRLVTRSVGPNNRTSLFEITEAGRDWLTARTRRSEPEGE